MYILETITAAELQDLLGSKKSHHGLKVIDARWDDTKLRTSIREEYDKEHIPFAIFYNHELVSDLSQQTPQAFPKLTDFVRYICLLYTSPSPRDRTRYRMPSSA